MYFLQCDTTANDITLRTHRSGSGRINFPFGVGVRTVTIYPELLDIVEVFAFGNSQVACLVPYVGIPSSCGG